MLDKNAQAWEIDSVLENFISGHIDPDEPLETVFPGTNKKIMLVSLTNKELRECDKKAREWAENTKIPYLFQRQDSEFIGTYACEVLAKAMRDPENGKPICSCGEELMHFTKRPHINKLWNQYEEYCKKQAISEPVWTVEKFNEIISKLKKSQAPMLLTEYDLSLVYNCLLYMVNQQEKSTG